jgi:hypothetical protein
MKVYSISKWTFFGISLLILLLPVSRHWQLLTSGERTTGTVKQYTVRLVEDIMGKRDLEEASEISFEAGGIVYKTYGPDNYEYIPGRRVPIFYKSSDPAVNCVATFTGFYLNGYLVLPIILLTVWYAFYLSFNNYSKRKKRQNEPSSRGPDLPFRKIH